MHQFEFPSLRQDLTASFPGNCSIQPAKGASVLFHPENGRCLHGACSLYGGPVKNLIEASGPAKQQAA
jgi:hypothetical protein